MPSLESLVNPDIIHPRGGGGRALGLPTGLPVSGGGGGGVPFFLGPARVACPLLYPFPVMALKPDGRQFRGRAAMAAVARSNWRARPLHNRNIFHLIHTKWPSNLYSVRYGLHSHAIAYIINTVNPGPNRRGLIDAHMEP